MRSTAQRHRTKVSRPQINLPTEEIEQEKPLYLVMYSDFFSHIESGDKDEEYRDNTEYYRFYFKKATTQAQDV